MAPLLEMKKLFTLVRVNVTFLVELSPECVSDDDLFIIGNVPALGRWKQHKLIIPKISDGTYSVNVSLPVGTPILYKVTRGKWGKEEVYGNGLARPNRVYIPRFMHENKIKIKIEGWADKMKPVNNHTITGTIKHHRSNPSQFLRHQHDVLVYLPRDYERNKDQKYPVCFFLDGQNIFDAATSFAGVEWQVDETLDDLEKKKLIEPIIAVAIYNAPSRAWEYSPTRFLGGGGLRQFARFIKEELTPKLSKRYRIDLTSGRTGVIGSSLGGLAAFHLGWLYPEFFQRIGVISPSLWWDHDYTLHLVKNAIRKRPIKIWLDMGELESEISFILGKSIAAKHVQKLKKALVNLGWEEKIDLFTMIDPQGSHDEASWARRFPDVISFLYGTGITARPKNIKIMVDSGKTNGRSLTPYPDHDAKIALHIPATTIDQN
ncbi:alpha/beta hydrolase-fold protein [candidate division CSSED10-310 bacterium]|uniref:Alpha/beta hydrolase-fold protein n=1 Tax=candidate division CSSED10-310 bacterium TaxID=2855610 RepID=A0ABV6Z0R7_UNCC1